MSHLLFEETEEYVRVCLNVIAKEGVKAELWAEKW